MVCLKLQSFNCIKAQLPRHLSLYGTNLCFQRRSVSSCVVLAANRTYACIYCYHYNNDEDYCVLSLEINSALFGDLNRDRPLDCTPSVVAPGVTPTGGHRSPTGGLR